MRWGKRWKKGGTVHQRAARQQWPAAAAAVRVTASPLPPAPRPLPTHPTPCALTPHTSCLCLPPPPSPTCTQTHAHGMHTRRVPGMGHGAGAVLVRAGHADQPGHSPRSRSWPAGGRRHLPRGGSAHVCTGGGGGGALTLTPSHVPPTLRRASHQPGRPAFAGAHSVSYSSSPLLSPLQPKGFVCAQSSSRTRPVQTNNRPRRLSQPSSSSSCGTWPGCWAASSLRSSRWGPLVDAGQRVA